MGRRAREGRDVSEGVDTVDLERFRVGLRRVAVRQGSLDRALRALIRGGCWLVAWRIESAGFDALPRGVAGRRGAGCLVVPAPHRAWVDPFLLLAAWPPTAARLVWFGDGPTMTRSWWRRWLFPRLGMIPISPRSGGPQAYADLAAEVTAAGAALVIFPEKGPPSPPESTRTISPGFAYLALRAGAPVIPVVLAGTHRILRGSSFTVDAMAAIDVGPADEAVFTGAGRRRAASISDRYRAVVNEILPARSALADARRPKRDRWPWLAALFH
jgi:1-acyl-sn-glycerol-3-phosphate acyltransferase